MISLNKELLGSWGLGRRPRASEEEEVDGQVGLLGLWMKGMRRRMGNGYSFVRFVMRMLGRSR